MYGIKNKLVDGSGSTKIKIPVIEMGSGKKIVTVVAGVHGNETTGLFVIQKLMDALTSRKMNCRVRIIPSANPLAQETKTRETIKDSLDMNRVFSHSRKKSSTVKIASKVVEIIKDSDVVIDLHTFGMKTPLTGILLKTDEKMTEKNKKMIGVFNPKQIWVIDTKCQKGEFMGSLGITLSKMGVVNFAVEMGGMEFVSSSDIQKCLKGILRVIRFVERERPGRIKKKIPVLERNVISTCEKGLFFPRKKTFQRVRRGEVLGELVILPGFVKKRIIAETSGIVMQISAKDMVIPGDDLSAIGCEVM